MRLYSHSASANCLKVRSMLGILGLPYELVEVDIFAGETLTDAFGRLNRLRETPVLQLDPRTCVSQSSAILSYLAEGTPWHGATRAERAQVAAWMHIEQDRVVPGIGGVRFRLATGRATVAELSDRVALGRATLDLLEDHLGDRLWLVGSAPTIADLSVWAYTHLADDATLPLAHWPGVSAWCARVRSIPGVLDDLAPYGRNARPGAGRSIYD